MHIKSHKLHVVQHSGSFVAKEYTDMLFHKEIIFTLFVLGNCQQLLACIPAEREQLVSQKINAIKIEKNY